MNQRPLGVTIIAILAFVGGAINLLSGLQSIGTGWGIVLIILGALGLYVGWGFWNLQGTAWRIGVILYAISVVFVIFFALISMSVLGPFALISAGIGVLIPVIILYYLSTPAVRGAFGQPTGGGALDAIMLAFGMGGGAAGSAAAPPSAPSEAATSAPPAPPAEPPAAAPPPPPPAAPAAEPPASSWTGDSGGGAAPSAGSEDTDQNA
jgi:hypothetical protein